MSDTTNSTNRPAITAALAFAATAIVGYLACDFQAASMLLGAGVAGIFSRKGGKGGFWNRAQHDAAPIDEELPTTTDPVEEPNEAEEALADTLINDGRYMLALRHQIAEMLDESARSRAIGRFEDCMSIVPSGQVVIGPIDEVLLEGKLDSASIAGCGGEVIDVDPFFLDRYPVTNEDYYRFVKAGGYEEIAIWDEAIWPEVMELVDATGQSGPRFWRNGKFLAGEEKLPVVGVNWFEAAAFARWVGKRLPSDAEWVKASAWPVTPKSGTWLQRRYPWGNTFDHQKANVWGSGPDCVVPVEHFVQGASAGGAGQMIGNVWEWTSCGFGRPDDYSLTLPVPMKSIRGGAYDTYFESQATCNFQSGENPLNRKHNIGFRLAVGACDIASIALQQMGLGAEPADPADEIEEVCV
ncbi:MAG: SUMF1/EgtB/PvdO family nonheme iron enzyme [Planctomycetales bacterium]|nr:SUMF1/EgtB/PvdO family nonheme iron enzyme [Planctomycetales bacterium]